LHNKSYLKFDERIEESKGVGRHSFSIENEEREEAKYDNVDDHSPLIVTKKLSIDNINHSQPNQSRMHSRHLTRNQSSNKPKINGIT